MKKQNVAILIAIIAVIFGSTMIFGSKSASATTESTNSDIEAQPISQEESIPSPFDGITNYFEIKDQKLLDMFNVDFPEGMCGLTVQDPWNGVNSDALQHSLALSSNSKIIYDILTNEDHTRSALVAINFIDPDRNDFENLINKLDYYPEASDEPYGYIAAWNSYIAVNGDFSELNYLYDTYPENLEGFPEYSTFYSLFNIDGYAYVLGIDIQNELRNVHSINDISEIYDNLMQCEYYGIRGYESYLDTNGFGIIIDNYADLKAAVSDPENSVLSEVYYLSENGGSDPTTDPDSEYYEAPIEDAPSTQTTTSNYPPKVNEYIAYGYKVYKHNMCDAYYYKEAFDRYVLFCIDNRDSAKGAWAQSIADPVCTSTFGVLTAIN